MKQTAQQSIERQHESKIVIYGGSSCLSSIDGARMEKVHQLPVLNLGLHAGMGAHVLTRYTLPTLDPGDTLIVELEPDLLTGSLKPPPPGVQFSFATKRVDALRQPDHVDWLGSLRSLRPGSEYILLSPRFFSWCEWRIGRCGAVILCRLFRNPMVMTNSFPLRAPSSRRPRTFLN